MQKLYNNIGISRESEYAYMATEQALNMAKIANDLRQKKEIGIIFGNDSSTQFVIESIDIVRKKKPTSLLGSKYFFQARNSKTYGQSKICKVS